MTTDNDTGAQGSSTPGSEDTASTEAPRRRRAASRPAGPPQAEATPAEASPTEASSTEAPQAAPTEPAPAKKTTRKRTVKKAAAETTTPPEEPTPEPAGAEVPAKLPGSESTEQSEQTEQTEQAAPAKRAPRKRAAKKAAPATELVESVPAESIVPAESAEQAESAVQAEPPAAREAISPEPAAEPSAEATDDAPAAAPPRPAALLFQAPDPTATGSRRRRAATRPAGPPQPHEESDEGEAAAAAAPAPAKDADQGAADQAHPGEGTGDGTGDGDDEHSDGRRRRRRRGGRGRRRRTGEDGADEHDESGGQHGDADDRAASDEQAHDEQAHDESDEHDADPDDGQHDDDGEGSSSSRRRRRRRRRGGGGDGDLETSPDDPPNTVVKVRQPRKAEDDVTALKGSTRLEAKRQRRREGRESGRRRHVITEAEFLARRESVERVMVVREREGRTQIGVLEDGVLVEHYVARKAQSSMIGNVYLGKVQNVLPSMEAAFVDIGKGRNAVLYAGEVNWDAAGLDGQPKRIEVALKSGDPVLVQVTKDPVGHKGARLTSQVSLPGRYLVYVPGNSMTGISRKLPDTERSRLKKILKSVVPDDAGVIVRTAAEGASEEELARDVSRLQAQWADIEKKVKAVNPPTMLHGEPDLTIRVVRDMFNEDFAKLVVSGDGAWATVSEYVSWVAPDLADRLERWEGEQDVFAAHRIDEQIAKALDRKVWLPSGGSLVIDRTEAMTVVDVNTGKFTGSGGNLEETVTKNNLEAAEEIVRQLRLRDIGGIIVVDFIDMVLESNRDLVLRRLLECLGRDRTKHQVAEVTSLGLVQMTRKRVGQGLLEAFSESCETCGGRGVIVHDEPVERKGGSGGNGSGSGGNSRRKGGAKDVAAATLRQKANDRPDGDSEATDSEATEESQSAPV